MRTMLLSLLRVCKDSRLEGEMMIRISKFKRVTIFIVHAHDAILILFYIDPYSRRHIHESAECFETSLIIGHIVPRQYQYCRGPVHRVSDGENETA